MSRYHSVKCTKEEAQMFRKEVKSFLEKHGYSFPLRALQGYDGNVVIYTGGEMEVPNMRSSFRRETPRHDEKGKVIGYHGTRGIHSQTIKNASYVYRTEWNDEAKEYLLEELKHIINYF